MNEDAEKRQNRYFSMRSLMDYVMGTIYLCLAFVFAFPEKFSISGFALLPEKGLRYGFSALIALYGLWRFYRGYRKNY